MTDAARGDGDADDPGKSAEEVIENAKDVAPVAERKRTLWVKAKEVDLNLQRIVGYGSLGLMFAQVLTANIVFIKYAHNVGWGHIPTGAIQAWLAATVVQVVGVVLVIARSVFPQDGRT